MERCGRQIVYLRLEKGQQTQMQMRRGAYSSPHSNTCHDTSIPLCNRCPKFPFKRSMPDGLGKGSTIAGEGMKGEARRLEEGSREEREGRLSRNRETSGGCRRSGALLIAQAPRGCLRMIVAHFSIICSEEPSANSEPLFSLKEVIKRDNETGGVIMKALVYLGNSNRCASF